jgi:hypothetical protein
MKRRNKNSEKVHCQVFFRVLIDLIVEILVLIIKIFFVKILTNSNNLFGNPLN